MGVIIVIIVLVRFWCSKWPTRIHITWLWCQDVSNCCLVKKGQQIRATAERIFFIEEGVPLPVVFLIWPGILRLWELLLFEKQIVSAASLKSSPFYTPRPPPTRPPAQQSGPLLHLSLPGPWVGTESSPALFLTSPTDWWPSPSSPPHSSLLSQKMSKYVQSLVHNIFSYKSLCSNSHIRI